MAVPSMSAPPDELQLYIRAELARIDQLSADAARKRQEFDLAPRMFRAEMWKIAVTLLGTGAALFAAGAAFIKVIG